MPRGWAAACLLHSPAGAMVGYRTPAAITFLLPSRPSKGRPDCIPENTRAEFRGPRSYSHFAQLFPNSVRVMLRTFATFVGPKFVPQLATLRCASEDCERSLLRRPSSASWSARGIARRALHPAAHLSRCGLPASG